MPKETAFQHLQWIAKQNKETNFKIVFKQNFGQTYKMIVKGYIFWAERYLNLIVITNPAGCVLRTFRCVGHGQPDPECSVLETKDSIETEMQQGEQLQELPGLGKIQCCCSSNVAEEQGAKEESGKQKGKNIHF